MHVKKHVPIVIKGWAILFKGENMKNKFFKRMNIFWIGIFLSIGSTVLGLTLLIDIFQKKQEAKHTFYKVVDINEMTEDPAEWGKNYPLQYEGYLKTVDQIRTKYGGSEALPRTPSQADPRSIVSRSKIEEDPRLKIMWSGYAFSKDFREERGHAFMLVDQLFTGRQSVPQPGACINCHASVVVPMKKIGNGDLFKGFSLVNQMSYAEAKDHFNHPISCIDCHDPKNMSLRVTRPAFIEGIHAFKKGQGIENYTVNSEASHQEMKTFVCAQCHVEYYFKGKEKRLTFPWSKGLKADQILSYYEEIAFKDWTHKETGTPALKAQHPEFEMWSQGIHARSGVSCVDCHMPYQRVGAKKITDHHVRSPLLNINRSCQTCHQVSEKDLQERVLNIQESHFSLRNVAMDALIELIQDIKNYRENNGDDKEVLAAQTFHRKAQFLLDFSEAENSTGFHAPQESARILGLSIDYARKGQNALKP
jgi:nitrite reductase (cytochrome c-552)